MSGLKVIKGNYPSGMNQLSPSIAAKISKSTPIGGDKNADQLQKDLSRTCYLSKRHTVDELQQLLLSEFYANNKKNVYSQGDLDGRTAYNFIFISLNEANEIEPLVYANAKHALELCYLDDNNQLSGCSITLAACLPLSTPVSYRFAISIFKNVTGLPEEREMLYISDESLLCADAITDDVSSKDAITLIKDTLQSELLFSIIAPILNNGEGQFASIEAFEQLEKCLSTNHNNFYDVQALQNPTPENKRRAKIEINQETFQKEIEATINPELKHRLSQPYLYRQRWSLSGIAALAILSVAAIVTLTIGLPFASIIAPAIIAFSLIVTAHLANKINKNETELSKYRDSRTTAFEIAMRNYDEGTRKIDLEYRDDLTALYRGANPDAKPTSSPNATEPPHFPAPNNLRESPKPEDPRDERDESNQNAKKGP